MKNNKLTLKLLKQELDNLKKSKTSNTIPDNKNSHNSEVAGHDIKGSYINRIYMKSSMFWLYIITGVLSYAHKIPYIGRIITLLGLWYGRTTWWKILVKLRKAFVMMNAAIGLMVIIKTTGFGTDNIIAGFSAIGHEYLQLLYNFTKRIFNWLVELFDHKIIPNVPTDPSLPKPKKEYFFGVNNEKYNPVLIDYFDNPIKESLRKSYTSLFNVNIDPTPNSISWYKDTSVWLWIGGFILSAGLIYAGYKFIVDPTFIESIPKNNPLPDPNAVASGSTTPSPDTPTQASFLASTKSIISTITLSTLKGIKKLNPLYWLPSTNEVNASNEVFMANQYTNNFNTRYFPFTAEHPFDPWYKKLRISWLGETTAELTNRQHIKNNILNSFVPIMPESPNIISSLPTTPSIGNVGLNITVNSGGAVESTSFMSIFEKVTSLPATPNMKPTPILPEFEGGLSSWTDHIPSKSIDKSFTYAKAVGKGIKGKAKWIPDNDNKFNELSEEII